MLASSSDGRLAAVESLSRWGRAKPGVDTPAAGLSDRPKDAVQFHNRIYVCNMCRVKFVKINSFTRNIYNNYE